MKKILSIFGLAIILALGVLPLVGCKKVSIVGKWELESVAITSNTLSKKDKADREAKYKENLNGLTFEFLADGTGTITQNQTTTPCSWKKSGKKTFKISFLVDDENITRDYYVNKKGKLVLSQNKDNYPSAVEVYGEKFKIDFIYTRI